MLLKALSTAVYGFETKLIDLEVDCGGVVSDQDHFHAIGLADGAICQRRDLVRSAIKNSGLLIAPTQIAIHLAPADLKKKAQVLISPSP